jgi:hypothetical protein
MDNGRTFELAHGLCAVLRTGTESVLRPQLAAAQTSLPSAGAGAAVGSREGGR